MNDTPIARIRDAVWQILFDRREVLLTTIVLLEILIKCVEQVWRAHGIQSEHAISRIAKELLLHANRLSSVRVRIAVGVKTLAKDVMLTLSDRMRELFGDI
jgi:hypothetical protein